MQYTASIRTGVSRFWWIPLLTGLISLGLGIWCLCSPLASLTVLAYIFAGLFVAAGVLNLCFALFTRKFGLNWGWSLVTGILEIIGGVWMFTLPQPALVSAFIFIIGIMILVMAINSLGEACMLSSFSGAAFIWMLLLLTITIIFAIVFLSSPIAGGIAVWLWIGISLITFGVYRLTLAGMLKSMGR